MDEYCTCLICLFCARYTWKFETIGMRSAKHSPGPVFNRCHVRTSAVGVYLDRIGHYRTPPGWILLDLVKGVGPELDTGQPPKAWIGTDRNGRMPLLDIPPMYCF